MRKAGKTQEFSSWGPRGVKERAGGASVPSAEKVGGVSIFFFIYGSTGHPSSTAVKSRPFS